MNYQLRDCIDHASDPSTASGFFFVVGRGWPMKLPEARARETQMAQHDRSVRAVSRFVHPRRRAAAGDRRAITERFIERLRATRRQYAISAIRDAASRLAAQ